MSKTSKVKSHIRRIRYPSGQIKDKIRIPKYRRRIVRRGILGRLFD